MTVVANDISWDELSLKRIGIFLSSITTIVIIIDGEIDINVCTSILDNDDFPPRLVS